MAHQDGAKDTMLHIRQEADERNGKNLSVAREHTEAYNEFETRSITVQIIVHVLSPALEQVS